MQSGHCTGISLTMLWCSAKQWLSHTEVAQNAQRSMGDEYRALQFVMHVFFRQMTVHGCT